MAGHLPPGPSPAAIRPGIDPIISDPPGEEEARSVPGADAPPSPTISHARRRFGFGNALSDADRLRREARWSARG